MTTVVIGIVFYLVLVFGTNLWWTYRTSPGRKRLSKQGRRLADEAEQYLAKKAGHGRERA